MSIEFQEIKEAKKDVVKLLKGFLKLKGCNLKKDKYGYYLNIFGTIFDINKKTYNLLQESQEEGK